MPPRHKLPFKSNELTAISDLFPSDPLLFNYNPTVVYTFLLKEKKWHNALLYKMILVLNDDSYLFKCEQSLLTPLRVTFLVVFNNLKYLEKLF